MAALSFNIQAYGAEYIHSDAKNFFNVLRNYTNKDNISGVQGIVESILTSAKDMVASRVKELRELERQFIDEIVDDEKIPKNRDSFLIFLNNIRKSAIKGELINLDGTKAKPLLIQFSDAIKRNIVAKDLDNSKGIEFFLKEYFNQLEEILKLFDDYIQNYNNTDFFKKYGGDENSLFNKAYGDVVSVQSKMNTLLQKYNPNIWSDKSEAGLNDLHNRYGAIFLLARKWIFAEKNDKEKIQLLMMNKISETFSSDVAIGYLREIEELQVFNFLGEQKKFKNLNLFGAGTVDNKILRIDAVFSQIVEKITKRAYFLGASIKSADDDVTVDKKYTSYTSFLNSLKNFSINAYNEWLYLTKNAYALSQINQEKDEMNELFALKDKLFNIESLITKMYGIMGALDAFLDYNKETGSWDYIPKKNKEKSKGDIIVYEISQDPIYTSLLWIFGNRIYWTSDLLETIMKGFYEWKDIDYGKNSPPELIFSAVTQPRKRPEKEFFNQSDLYKLLSSKQKAFKNNKINSYDELYTIISDELNKFVKVKIEFMDSVTVYFNAKNIIEKWVTY